MPRSPLVDGYIAEAGAFARPILDKVRALFHRACPKLAETIKWGFPHFEHKGIVGSMAAFKRHVSVGFWKAALLKDPEKILANVGNTSMAALKVSSLDELPPEKVLIAYVKEAVLLNEQGVKIERPDRGERREVEIPQDLAAALEKNARARAAFDAFPPSHRREYVEWITEAKRAETRARRVAATIDQLTAGKSKNWKYEKC